MWVLKVEEKEKEKALGLAVAGLIGAAVLAYMLKKK